MANEDDVRRIALSLPETVERPSYGTPGFRVKDVLFVRFHEQPEVLVAFRSSVEDRDALVLEAPDRFFATPHYANHPIVLVRLARIDEDDLRALLWEAWHSRAPTRLRAAHPLS